MATTIPVGHTTMATRLKKATNGVQHRAIVTPATVRMRPVKVSCPVRIKTTIKLFIWPNNLLLPTELATVIAITFTFYK